MKWLDRLFGVSRQGEASEAAQHEQGATAETTQRPPASNLQFARLFDQDKNIIGIWVKDRADAENGIGVSVWLMQLGAPERLCQEALAGHVKIVPNNQDDRGGYFVFVGPARFSV